MGENSLDLLFLNLSPIPKVKWHEPLMEMVSRIVKPGKFCYIITRSSDMSHLTKSIKGFVFQEDDRFKGNRGILLKKGPSR